MTDTPRIANQETEQVRVDRLVPHPRNPRRGDVEAIRASIRAHGFYGTIVAQRSTGRILAGNHRWEAARAEGLGEVPVVWVDVDDDTATRILLADNRTADLADYDNETLTELLSELRDFDGGNGLHGTGYTPDDLDALIREIDGPKEGRTDPDDVPEVSDVTTEPGNLWVLGEHRLLCGDATDADDVGRLLDGDRPNLMVTDPPYGVNYDAAWRQEAAEKGQLAYAATRVGDVKNDDRKDWYDAFVLHPGDVAYCWSPAGSNSFDFHEGLVRAGFEVRMQLVWAKRHFPISRGHYHVRHEPCWYAVRAGCSAGWAGDRKQTTVWDDITLDKNVEGGHSTQKPVECMERPIRNHKGDVYDPFLGSGTTLIAAERTGRTCYGLEIDPHYVDVIVRRWEAFTGEKAERL